MDDALVVLDDREDSGELLREAGAYASGADADLVLYVPLSEGEFGDVVSALDEIGRVENKDYSDEEAMGIARQHAAETAEDALEGFDVEWTIVADRSEEVASERVIEVAEEHGCDHVFTLGSQRSPTGKAVFGDETQRLILNFCGYVTVKME
ncbi:universal stress protein [Halomicrobium urmianum]|uniref:universal stress protein n=1 Tax=Halomicrobium urmianum TaxID=1586233 RepID=UPI001CDA2308|nr:universal stress protein [Halomicrobium urmianum]